MNHRIETKNLQATYSSGNKFSVKDIEFTLEGGEVLAVLGRNASGKTTLMHALSGRMPINAGSVIIDGAEYRTNRTHFLEEIAYVDHVWAYESPNGIFGTVERIGRYYGSYFSRYSDELFLSLCGKLELPVKASVRKLSTGDKIKFSLAFALARRPKVLFLDEPFANLDPLVRGELMDLLRIFLDEENITVIFASHIVEEMQRICDKVLYLSEGRQILFADMNEIQDSYFPGRQIHLDELYDMLDQEKQEEDLIGDAWKLPEDQI